MTQALQLLVAAGVAIGLAVFALRRDKKEHCDARQRDIYFPEPKEHDERQRGAAMSHIG
jgi:hypothetical protein